MICNRCGRQKNIRKVSKDGTKVGIYCAKCEHLIRIMPKKQQAVSCH